MLRWQPICVRSNVCNKIGRCAPVRTHLCELTSSQKQVQRCSIDRYQTKIGDNVTLKSFDFSYGGFPLAPLIVNRRQAVDAAR